MIVGSHLEFPMTIRSELRLEEHTEEENRSQASDLSAREPSSRRMSTIFK
jgi:hypothetical protein